MCLPLFLSPPPSSSSGTSSPSVRRQIQGSDPLHPNAHMLLYDNLLLNRLLRFLRILGHRDANASDCMNDILVQDSNAFIRKRALELVYLLVNESNGKSLTKELIKYQEVSDQDFKGDLTAKICSIVEK
ncbi:AP-1 complex subunit gamma-2 [Camellia lanceoleosa]|uniref:AP-1 complex subunit gamma-2 n=1 Tax=Camellia lanceoleosa TaxID=1840588 RepID=A0ACC0FEW4_9ERIC|nr:AP-1 complex subunit gamma-2 [Camellia lanceoleosa]